eukprot:14031922-Alexandrium_andersonii.AAC.1
MGIPSTYGAKVMGRTPVPNADVLKRSRQDPVIISIRCLQLFYLGHVSCTPYPGGPDQAGRPEAQVEQGGPK